MLTRMIAVVLVLFLVPSLAFDVAPPPRAELIVRSSPPVEVKVRPGVTGAPAKVNETFKGGFPPKSKDPCMAFTPHGFFGIEDKVVEAIADFIREH